MRGEIYRYSNSVLSVLRFIPTCVGNSNGNETGEGVGSVHPHVCGELGHIRKSRPFGNGSSPRVWGTPDYPDRDIRVVRFIPTCVGNSLYPLTAQTTEAVHPHVCGELNVFDMPGSCPGGSSPRVWGTLAARGTDWILPSVHPHVCGELHRPASAAHVRIGSSPRVWGTPSTSMEEPIMLCGSSPRVWGTL